MNTSRIHGKHPGAPPPQKARDVAFSGASEPRRGETSCLGFVNDLTRLAEKVRQAAPGLEGRRRLAGELVYRFVPPTTILGVRVRRWIAGPDPESDRADDACNRWGGDGFRPTLVRGGQDEEVVRHVAAAAACVLLRRAYLVQIASGYDWLQGIVCRRAEAKAEIAGNAAGMRVGRVLAEYMAGRLGPSRLKIVLGAVLCE